MLLNTLRSQNPSLLWGFWSASWQNHKHLAFSGSNVTAAKELKAEEDEASREYFQLALQGGDVHYTSQYTPRSLEEMWMDQNRNLLLQAERRWI
jgi:hypothetical protein